jgi:hypothetical protein
MAAEVNQVSDDQMNSAEPENEGCEHEHEVGVISLELRKLHFLYRQYLRRSREIGAGLQFCGAAERETLETESRRYQDQADTLMEVFWTSCRAAFPELWGKSLIGMRKGWKIVWSEHESRPSLGLFGLLGGDLFEMAFAEREPSGKPN